MIRARKAVFPVALALLIGCGGSSSVSNAAHLRFFNGLNDTDDVRLYVGGRLYQAGGDASIGNGDAPKYGDVPSGTESLILNKYDNTNTGTNSSTLASLTSQTLLEGRNYTAYAYLSGTTKKLAIFSDNVAIDDNLAYFRIVNANNTTSPIYVDVTDETSNTDVNSTSLASGAATSVLQDYATSSTDASHDIVIHVYSDSDFSNEIATQKVSLSLGKVVTTFIYNKKSGSGLSFRSSTDQDTNVTATTTGTTGTTGGDTTGTTGETGGTSSGTTAS